MLTEWYRVRLAFCFVCIALFFILIFARVTQLQVLPSSQLDNLSKKQFRQVVKKTNTRSPLFDRNYEELAVSVPAGSVYARPKLIKQKVKVARVLNAKLGGGFHKWITKISQKKSFVWVQRQVNSDVAKDIASLKLAGIYVESEPRRLYPNGSLAAHVLGFTDLDGKGISGTELKANDVLTEEDGSALIYKDGKGNAAYIKRTIQNSDSTISGLALTIDRRIQSVLEEEIVAAMKETGAKSAMGIVMDPHTGEIFAMGQSPNFDPNNFKNYPVSTYSNQLTSSLFEPGSTVKPLIVASALQDGRFSKSSLIDCGGGKMKIGHDTISEAESHEKYYNISLEKIIQVSSNVGAAKLGLALGQDKVRSIFDRFGLTRKSGIQLPGEAASPLRAVNEWVPMLLATASFGQGVAVTPLQMVLSYAPFANGGFLIQPKIYLNENLNGNEPPQLPTRILSPKIAAEMTNILIGVTESKEGTGKNAKIPGIKVAGKTGTAQKYVPGKGYDGKKYFSSFIGYLPADHPQLLIGVMVDEPKFPYYASDTAAPLFRKIAERSIQLLDKTPREIYAKSKSPDLPDIKENHTKNEKNMILQTLTDSETWPMPDLKGLSLKEAYEVLGQYSKNEELNIKYKGTGFLEKQEPLAGASVSKNQAITLHFSSFSNGF